MEIIYYTFCHEKEKNKRMTCMITKLSICGGAKIAASQRTYVLQYFPPTHKKFQISYLQSHDNPIVVGQGISKITLT